MLNKIKNELETLKIKQNENKTVKTLVAALILTVSVTTLNASETEKSSFTLAEVSEYELNVEPWMVDVANFDLKKLDSEGSSVVEIAAGNPDFSILVEAVTKAKLVDALSADGPFTVFAPTNEAFKNLFKELGVSGIKDLTAEQLTPILKYHVVSGKVMSTDLTNTSVATLNGEKIKVDLSNGVMINDSKVVKADISGSNGVVHVIDKVLIPN